jgi:hypothetical protein
MRPILPKASVQRRKLSVTLDETPLQQVDELVAFPGSATDRVYIVEQVLGAHHCRAQGVPALASQRNHTSAQPVPVPESGETPPWR